VERNLRVLGLLLTLFFIGSCASPPPAPPEWKYEKEAIRILLKADSQLNELKGVPYTLLLCAYQLRDPNSFNQLAKEREGLTQLLECNLFDGSVAGSRRLIVHPGQDQTLSLDRPEGAKYLALVAGYYLLDKDRMVRLVEFPVVSEKQGWRTSVTKPGRLNLEVTLGPQQIEHIEVR
jgi:type VI secretion system VasD/TssJ family lipoprotein